MRAWQRLVLRAWSGSRAGPASLAFAAAVLVLLVSVMMLLSGCSCQPGQKAVYSPTTHTTTCQQS